MAQLLFNALVLISMAPAWASAFGPLPDTEVGNVVVRNLDNVVYNGFPLYLGHTAILGEWGETDASDPSDYDIYDSQANGTSTIRVNITWYHATIKKRTFADFTQVNTLTGQNYLSYQGGYTRSDSAALSPPGSPMSPFLRSEIVTRAETWVGADVTYNFFPFTKKPSTSAFRCDGWVEYIFEASGMGEDPNVFGAIPQGLWKNFMENSIVAPQMYASPIFVTHREPGLAPQFSITAFGGADVTDGATISSTTVIVSSTETATGSGLALITLSGPSSDSRSVGGLTASEVFSGLVDGSYSVTVYDLAGNSRSSEFIVKTTGPTGGRKDKGGNPTPEVVPSTRCISGTAVDVAGIASITITAPGGFSDTTYFDCSAPVRSTSAVSRLLCNLAASTYTITATNCAEVDSTTTTVVNTAASTGMACLAGDCKSLGTVTSGNAFVRVETNTCGTPCDYNFWCEQVARLSPQSVCRSSGGGLPFYGEYTGSCMESFDFTITNSTPGSTPWPGGVFIIAGLTSSSVNWTKSLAPGGALSGSVTVPQTNSVCRRSNTDNTVSVNASYTGILISLLKALLDYMLDAAKRRLLHFVPNSWTTVSGSVVAFDSGSTIVFNVPAPAGVVVTTSTLAIYRFDGVDWSSASITNQYIYQASSSSVIIATGTIAMSGEFALFFHGVDTAAPTTTFSIQGTTYTFDGTIFVSTDAYVVLSATDTAVNGFASGVATTVYRMDAMNPDDAYSTYTSSFPLSLGTHVFEYYSYDWAGNTETVKTATFTVTAGSGFKNTGDQRVTGGLLVGYLGSGAQAEIVSSAENAYTLLVSSVNRAPMLSVTNIGSVGVGPQTPEGRLDLGQGSLALELRSGNATSTGTAIQMTFGYSGDYAMRHALRTRHSTSTDGNRMDFLLWTPATGATTTVAATNVLSLQGISTANDGSFHVMPAGEPDAEVEVSNGSSLGGGTIQRREVLTPSSRRFKSDIRYLDVRQEDAALDEVSRLEHVRFRYKSRDGTPQPMNVGLIYEEAPETIRAPEKTLSATERMAQVEMALKAALRRVEALEKRREELSRRRRTP